VAVQAIKVTLGANLGEGSFNSSTGFVADPVAEVAVQAALLVTAKAKVVLGDTAVGTVVTDLTTAFTAQDVFGAALVAITGDSYSAVTHQWTNGGATGLTHAQVVTLMALFNTASAAFVTAQTDANTAKTATALAVTDTNLVTLVAVTTYLGGNLVLLIDTAVITTSNAVKWATRLALQAAKNIGIVSP